MSCPSTCTWWINKRVSPREWCICESMNGTSKLWQENILFSGSRLLISFFLNIQWETNRDNYIILIEEQGGWILNALPFGRRECCSNIFLWCFFWQTRSVSRWSDCAGPPEGTCRSSASTSNADGRSVSLAAASCDPFLTPCGPEGRAKNRGCKLEIHLNTGWKRPLFDSWNDGGFWCTVFTQTLTSDPVI